MNKKVIQLALGLCLSASTFSPSEMYAQRHYEFRASEYVSTDNNRAPQSAFSYDVVANTFTITASGDNNIAFKMGKEQNGEYYINQDERWFVACGTNLTTGSGKSYLWWFNGTNNLSQVAPDHEVADGDNRIFIWNMRNGNPLFSGIDFSLDRIPLTNKGSDFILAMGLTSSVSSATITDVNYLSDVEIAVKYPAAKSALGLTDEALATAARNRLNKEISAAERLLAERTQASASDQSKLQTAINTAKTQLAAITTSNYAHAAEVTSALVAAEDEFIYNTHSYSYSQTANAVIARLDDLKIRIQFYNDSTLRVTKTYGEFDVEPSLVVIKSPMSSVPFSCLENDGELTVSTSKVRVVYDLRHGVAQVFRADGTQLIAEQSFTMKSTTDGPHASYDITQKFTLDADERIYGLGQVQNGQLEMRGVTMSMVEENRSIYIPYFYSSKHYGLYWDNYSPTTFQDNSEQTSFTSTGTEIDYYVLVSANSQGVLKSLRNMTGETKLPPLWNFGLYQSKQRYTSAQEVIDVVKKYRDLQVPLDCIVQDWQYWGGDDYWNAMQFLNPTYADYANMISSVHGMNTKFMISVWANFGFNTDQYKEFEAAGRLIPIQSYPPSCSVRPYDVYDSHTSDRFWEYLYNGLMNKGVDALWLDSSEPDEFSNRGSDYDYVTGYHHRTYRSLRNAFPLCHVSGVANHHRAQSELSNKRVSILTRSAFAGMQRTGAFVWSADIVSSWETLAAQIPAACNFSVCGLPYWNSDTGAFFIGSYGGVGDGNWRRLYNRWTQFSAFCPMMRFHGDQTPREIYQFGTENDAQGDFNNILRYVKMRYRMLPYLYSTAHQVVSDSKTFMTAMPVAFEDDAQCAGVKDQYMFGESFLVAPVVEDGVARRDVYLPAGKTWFDFWTGAAVEGGKKVSKDTPADIMPLYIPAGTIMPWGPDVQYSSEKNWDNLEVRIYPGANGSFVLYEDELDGYGYENGQFAEIPFSWDEATQTLTIGARKGSFNGMLNNRTFNIVRVDATHGMGDLHATKYDATVSYDGSQIQVKLGGQSVELIAEDMTDLIVNPSFEADARTLNKTAPQGWTVNSNTAWWGVNTGGGGGDPMATDGTYIFGVWDGGTSQRPEISQVVNLPKGKYRLTVDMQASNRSNTVVRLGNQRVFANEAVGYFKDQLSTAGTGDNYPMQTFGVDFAVEDEQADVKIGVTTDGASAETWFKIDNFRLYSLTNTTTLDEAVTFTPCDLADVSVILKRHLTANCWNTLVLPFTLETEDLKAWLGDDVECAAFTGTEETETTIKLLFASHNDMLQANVPYLVYPKQEVSDSHHFGETSLQNTDAPTLTPSASSFSFVGNYASDAVVPADAYFINTHNELKRSLGSTGMKAFRGYFEGAAGASVKAVSFEVNGESTAIESVSACRSTDVKVYTIDGRSVVNKPTAKGIYIVNGKKVMFE